ncbi:MAG: type I-A CRISPR-associated protein Cas7/Csa2 [Candidatus Korarchaeota archaeon]|nr:type I-A CRISPR-associated protein Cas7/Csa2 [Candidatus Korarchaeota archaeon]
MGDVFLSIRGRVLINVEALNMTESIGNYVKHRRVPVVLPGTYVTYFVPAISGESLAHGYQSVLAEEATKKGLPACKLCREGIFLKSTNESVFREAFGVDPPQDDFEFEKHVIGNCIVEDVGGFLFAPAGARRNVKRTSNFFVGYMIPTRESLEAAVIEPQLHSRYALGTPFVRREDQQAERAGGQMIYYVELSSAVYTFSFDLDTRFIGKTAFVYGKVGTEVDDKRKLRIEASLDALVKFVTEMMFGAKKTRFLPVVEWESLVAAVSDDVWTIPSPFSKDYIAKAEEKVKKVNHNTSIFKYEGGPGLEAVLEDAVEEAKRRIGT